MRTACSSESFRRGLLSFERFLFSYPRSYLFDLSVLLNNDSSGVQSTKQPQGGAVGKDDDWFDDPPALSTWIRICSVPGCKGVLSRYNNKPRCSFHPDPEIAKKFKIAKGDPPVEVASTAPIAPMVKATVVPTAEEILVLTCQERSVRREELLDPKRRGKFHITRARMIAMYLLHEDMSYPFAEIGALLGRRDRATVFPAVKKIKKLIGEEDRGIRDSINHIRAHYKGSP